MADNNQNLVQFRLTGTLSVSGSTVNISNDILRDTAISVADASITLQNEGGTTFELIKGTITAGVLTTSARGIKQDKTLTEDATLKREWRPGTIGFVTLFASDTVDREGDTLTGPIAFSGTTNSGIRISNLTTTQRLALTPANGVIVYDTTLGENYQYIGGAWSAVSAGSTQANASTTVAGKVEIATQVEFDAGTTTGGTGALLVATPDLQLKQINTATAKTTMVGADLFGIADSADSGKLKKITLTNLETQLKTDLPVSTSNLGFATMATDIIASTGTDETTYINPKQAKANYLSTGIITAGTTYNVGEEASGTINTNSITYIKKIQISIPVGGTYRVTNKLVGGGGAEPTENCYSRIYKNGVAIGTERSQALNVAEQTYTEDFTFATGDLVQLYLKVSTSSRLSVCNQFKVSYNFNVGTVTTY